MASGSFGGPHRSRRALIALSRGGDVLGCTGADFLAGLVLGAPLAGAAVGAVIGGTGTARSPAVEIGEDFTAR
jgi:hypothetical protein